MKVPPVPGAAEPTAADLANLSQAERAERALAQGRRERTVPIDRAFLEAALDFRQTLRVLVAAVVPDFADWCLVDLVDGNGVPRRVEVAHADPAKAPLAKELRDIGVGAGWATPAAQTIRDRTPRLFSELSDELIAWATHDERHAAALRAIRPSSLLSVPLVARDRVIGALTIIRSETRPALDEDALVFAGDLAVPAALALDGARAYQAERAARASAEELADREHAERVEARRAEVRLRRLESLSTSLSSLLSPEAVARTAVESGLSLLEPSTATVVRATPSGDALEVLWASGWPDDLARELRALRPDDPALVAESYRSQAAIWLPSADALGAAYPSAAPLERRLGDEAAAALPLRVDGRTIGAIGLGFPRARDLDADERRFALAVAALAAQALERARLRDG